MCVYKTSMKSSRNNRTDVLIFQKMPNEHATEIKVSSFTRKAKEGEDCP